MRTLVIALVLIGLHACGDDLECGDGTVKRGKICVPGDDICPAGEVWENGDCRVATVCGDGTTNVGGRCVPDENLCDTGEVYLDGGCVEQCGAGTLVDVATGSCVPIDPTAGAAAEVEPNDPINVGVGVANAITLPAAGQAALATGTIAAPADLDGDGELDDDFDVFTFDGTAGTRLHIEATAVGAPEVAFMLARRSGGESTWVRLAFPVAERNAARQVVLPFTGSYSLLIGEGSAVAGVDGLGWTGGVGFTYVVAVTPIANPAPTISTSGDFEAAGDLADVPQFLVDVATGTILEAWLAVDSDATAGVLWFASSTHATYFGEFSGEPALVQVPASGLLVTADFGLSLDGMTGYRLQTVEHPVTSLDLSATVSRPGESVAPGGMRFYGVTLADDRVVRASADLSLGDADVTVSLLDADLNAVAVSNTSGSERSFTAVAAAGDYTLAVYEVGALADAPGVFSFDLSVDSWPLAPIGSGTVDSPFTTLETLDILFAQAGERAYFWFDAVAVGQLVVLAAPNADFDPVLALYDNSLLATGDGVNAAAFADDQGPGADEAVNLAAAPGRYFVSLEAAAAVADSAADITVDFTGSKTPYVLEGPATSDEPTDLGTLSTTPVLGLGELSRDELGSTDDYWQFALAAAGRVGLETAPYGGATADTTVSVWDEDGRLVAFEDYGGVGDYARVDVSLPAGDYILVVNEYFNDEGGTYVLEAVVEEEILCVPGSARCAGADLMACDAGGQSETARPCTQGCTGSRCIGIAETADNDSWVDAQDLDDGGVAIGAGFTVVNGAIDDVVAGRDMDWYTFTLDSAATISVSTWAPAPFDTELWLYRAYDPPPPDIVEVANNDDAPGTVLSRLGPETLTAGEYWVRVGFAADRESQTGAYELTIDVEPLACFPDARVCNAGTLELCNGDGSVFLGLACISTCAAGACDFVVEVEPNDSDPQAQDFATVALDTRIPVRGEIANPSDGDWIRFEITANALVRVETVPTGGGDVDTRLSLYASGDIGTAIATDNDGGVGTYSLIDTFLSPDIYYVAVQQAAGDSGTYLVVIDVVTPECVGAETRCSDAVTLDQCDRGRWVPWSCLTTCGGTPAACEPLSVEVIFGQPFAAAGTVVRRFGAEIGDKLNFESAPTGTLDTRLFLCAATSLQCDFFNGWLRRNDTIIPAGGVDEISDWVVPSTGEYLFGVEWVAGAGVADVRVTPIPIPKIVSVDYPIAARGSVVVLTGSNLTDVNAVTVGGQPVAFAADSDAQVSLAALPDTTPIGVAVPVVVTSPTLGASGPFELTVINLLLSEIDANTPGADADQLVEVSTGFPGLDMTGSGYVVVFVNGSDAAAGEVYRSGIALDAVADGDGLILLGNATVSPDILFNDSLQNGYDGVAIVQAAAVTSGTAVSDERIIDAVVYEAGSTQGQIANLAFLWTTGSGVIDEGANGAVETESLQRCALDRRGTAAWEVASPTSGTVNVCSGGGSINTYAVSGVPVNIPDPGTVCVDVVVPALPFGNTMTDVRATAGLNHGFAGQIDIVVASPASTSVLLTDSNGSFYDFSSSWPVGFEDGGIPLTPLANIIATVSGSIICGAAACAFAPQQPLSAFNGAQAVGTWTVCVGDNNVGIAGEIHSFELELTTGP